MPFLVLVCLIALPLLEIATFIVVGDAIGVLPTIGLIILSAVVGMAIVRRQGLSLLMKTQADLRQSDSPAEAVSHGFFLVLAGFLLAIPGFLTDIVAFLLLIPMVRTWITATLIAYVQRTATVSVHMGGQGMNMDSNWDPNMGPRYPGGERSGGDGPIIEGEIVEDLTPRSDAGPGNRGNNLSPWRQ